jgi:hypothetical protein
VWLKLFSFLAPQLRVVRYHLNELQEVQEEVVIESLHDFLVAHFLFVTEVVKLLLVELVADVSNCHFELC